MLHRFLLMTLTLTALVLGNEQNASLEHAAAAQIQTLTKPMYNPFVERYLIDEVKDLRVQQQNLRVEVIDRIAQSRLDVSDRAMNYMSSTVNNIFFILTAVASLVALFGWKSIKDAREQTKMIVQERVEAITEEYENKLARIEDEMHQRSMDILANQERISRSNEVHALWRRSHLEENIQAKIDVYDQIIALDPENVEALAYKADAVLDLGEREWALNLCNQALELDADYAYSHWQRACVNAELGNVENAIADIFSALELSPTLISDLENEKSFDGIRDDERFIAFINEELTRIHASKEGANA